MMSNEVTFWGKNPGLGEFCGGQGRDRTVDLPIFSTPGNDSLLAFINNLARLETPLLGN